MRRDLVFLSEMIDAAEQAMALVAGRSIGDIEGDRRTRDALLWNVTVLGEAANRVSELTQTAFPGFRGRSRPGYEIEWFTGPAPGRAVSPATRVRRRRTRPIPAGSSLKALFARLPA